ncbi:FkbM family methyltransferase [Salinisphaera shabanensis T35B1]
MFVDVGANQGEFTVCAASVVPCGHVIAVEPISSLRERLKLNVEANKFQNVYIWPFGLSDVNKDDVPIFGEDRLFADGTRHIGLPTLYDIDKRRKPIARVDLRKLDDVLKNTQRVDVIKIDVEGAELYVLEGAARTIQREQPSIIFEANEETSVAAGYKVKDIYAWLEDRGYSLHRICAHGELSTAELGIPFSNILARPRRAESLQATRTVREAS